MATVRFSEALKSDIRRNAERVFTKQNSQYQHEFPEKEVEELYVEYIDSLGFKPEHEPFLGARGELYIQTPENNSHRLRFFSGYVFPKQQTETSNFTINPAAHGAAKLTLKETFRTKSILDKINAYFEERQQKEQEGQEFVKSVMQITETFSTLAPALKEWPPLWHLLPEETQERHKKIVERKTKKAELDKDNLDMDKLTSTVIASKLKGD